MENVFVTRCLICQEDTPVAKPGNSLVVCEHCRLVIMEMRKQLNRSCGNCTHWVSDTRLHARWCPTIGNFIHPDDPPCSNWELGE